MVRHFSHDHPLIFREDEDETNYEKPRFCKACGLPMLSSPSYSCSINGCDDFVLHKTCMYLPLKLQHKVKCRTEHDLDLHAKPPSEKSCNCSKCGKECKNFTYHCSKCEFNLHPYCAHPLKIKSKHRSHHHPLVAMCREAVSIFCDACGTKHKGQFFSCQQCNFWIHQDCLLLPSIMRTDHSHPLTLTYSVDQLKGLFPILSYCEICKRDLATSLGSYFCYPCSYFVHLKCALSNMANWDHTIRRVTELPDEVDTFLSLAIGENTVGMTSRGKKEIHIHKDGMPFEVEKCHSLPWIFNGIDDHKDEEATHHQQSSSSSSSSSSIGVGVCNACIRPIISPPFYRCPQPECDFCVHEFCWNLPSHINYGAIEGYMSISHKLNLFFFSVFRCCCCNLLCNGLGYIEKTSTVSNLSIYKSIIDVECAFAPSIIRHQSHHQHILHLVHGGSAETIAYSCCSSNHEAISVYICSSCDYKIHVRCAILPKTVSHDFDEHRLQLMFGATDLHSHEENYYFCEICEGDINPRFWFYSCVDCDQSFHVECIPSVGLLSKIKFGGILKLSCHPHHPLTLIRMLTIDSKMCWYCEKIINGFVDDMAFQCSECDYMIHFNCTENSVLESERSREAEQREAERRVAERREAEWREAVERREAERREEAEWLEAARWRHAARWREAVPWRKGGIPLQILNSNEL